MADDAFNFGAAVAAFTLANCTLGQLVVQGSVSRESARGVIDAAIFSIEKRVESEPELRGGLMVARALLEGAMQKYVSPPPTQPSQRRS